MARARRSPIRFHRRSQATLYLSVPLLLAAALLQSTLFAQLRLFGAAPDLVLVAVVAWTLLRGTPEGYVWAFAGGLALDLLSGGPFGLSALVLLLIAAVLGLTEGQVHQHATAYAFAATAGATLLFHAGLWLALALAGRPLDGPGVLVQLALAGLVLNLLVLGPIRWLLLRLYHAAELAEVAL
jgi:rod shape-determining protein MreD